VSSPAIQQNLKLVGVPRDSSWSHAQRAKLEVVKENRLAAHANGLDPRDPRWILAMQTQARLQGSMLTADRRQRLMNSAKKLGMRPFEANLVIAIVQDRARIGQPVETSTPTLRLMREVDPQTTKDAASEGNWARWFAAIAGAAALAGLILRWLSGA